MTGFVDMGQADSSLYAKPRAEQSVIPWTRALIIAAKEMGYDHYCDVPDARVEELKQIAYLRVRGE